MLSCESFLGCLVPYHGGPTGCFCLFLLLCHRPSPQGDGSASRIVPANTTFRGRCFRGCRHFFMFKPPTLLTLQVVPTVAQNRGKAARVFTSGLNVLRCLRTHPICSPPEYRQLTVRGLTPR